jgi:hypothetical protein
VLVAVIFVSHAVHRAAYHVPMPSSQTTIDLEHLRLLSVFHYVYAGLLTFVGCVPIIHVSMGIAILNGAFQQFPQQGNPQQQLPREAGWFFVGFGSCAIVFFWLLAVLTCVAGRRLGKRRGRVFCIVVACLECLMFPLGTILGVFTLIVLMRPTVIAIFDARPIDNALLEKDDDELYRPGGPDPDAPRTDSFRAP